MKSLDRGSLPWGLSFEPLDPAGGDVVYHNGVIRRGALEEDEVGTQPAVGGEQVGPHEDGDLGSVEPVVPTDGTDDVSGSVNLIHLGSATESRTPVPALRGRCPGPLDDGATVLLPGDSNPRDPNPGSVPPTSANRKQGQQSYVCIPDVLIPVNESLAPVASQGRPPAGHQRHSRRSFLRFLGMAPAVAAAAVMLPAPTPDHVSVLRPSTAITMLEPMVIGRPNSTLRLKYAKVPAAVYVWSASFDDLRWQGAKS